MAYRRVGISAAWLRMAILLLAFGFGVVACGPIGPFAGGRLSGEVGPAQVSDWSHVAELETVNLETRPADPHSITIWFASSGANLYIATSMISGPREPAERSWSAHVAEDSRVRIRIDGVVYERLANKLEDATEFDMARAALEAKYEIKPEDRDPERVIWIYRLDER